MSATTYSRIFDIFYLLAGFGIAYFFGAHTAVGWFVGYILGNIITPRKL